MKYIGLLISSIAVFLVILQTFTIIHNIRYSKDKRLYSRKQYNIRGYSKKGRRGNRKKR